METSRPLTSPVSEVLPLRRQRLFDLVWQKPMLHVAALFGVSSTYLARVCVELNVPRPSRGYWAKLAAGKVLPKPALPSARPGDATEWNPGAAIATRPVHLTSAPASEPTRSRAARDRRHLLLSGIEAHFLKTRGKKDELLRPFKFLLVDLVVSEANLANAIQTASEFFTVLCKRGHRVVIAPPHVRASRIEVDVRERPRKNEHPERTWQPSRPTVVYIGDVPIGLTLFETTEEVEVMYVDGDYVPVNKLTVQQRRRNSWTTTRRYPSGRLCLQAYSVYYRAPWSKQWRETRRGDLGGLMSEIVTFLEGIAPDIGRRVAEAQELARAEERARQEAWRRRQEEAENARLEALRREARKDLLAAIAGWHEAIQIEAYFDAAQRAAADMPQEQRLQITQRLDVAKALVGKPAPLDLLKRWKAPDERG